MLVGDPKQLGPTLAHSREATCSLAQTLFSRYGFPVFNLQTWVSRRFWCLLPPPRLALPHAHTRLLNGGLTPIVLRTQYRCHPAISAIANKLFYNNEV